MPSHKPRRLTTYNKQLLGIVDQYAEETGDHEPDNYDVAQWAYAKGLLDKPHVDLVRILARALSRACRQDYFPNENDELVRHRHSIKERRGDRQTVFWFKMEDATPEKMRISAQQRRRGIAADVFQLDRDLTYYNEHYNPGDAIGMDYNLNADVEERRLPTEYPDAPPEVDQDHFELS